MALVLDKLTADLHKELLRRRYPAGRCIACCNRDEIVTEEPGVGVVYLTIGCEHVDMKSMRFVSSPGIGQVSISVTEMKLLYAKERPDAVEYIMTWFERLWTDLTDARLV